MSPSDSPDHPGSILYYSESSDVPYSTSSWSGTFFAVSYSKSALVTFAYCLSLLHLPGFILYFNDISDMYQIDIDICTIYKFISTVKSRAVDRSTIHFLSILGVLLAEMCY